MSVDSTLLKTLAKPALAGALAAGGAYILFGEGGSIQIFGMSVNALAAIGISTAASQYVGEIAGNYLLPMIQSNMMANIESSLLNPVMSGASLVVLLGPVAGVIDSDAYLQVFALGVASDVGAFYLEQNFLDSWLGKQ